MYDVLGCFPESVGDFGIHDSHPLMTEFGSLCYYGLYIQSCCEQPFRVRDKE